MTRLRRALSAPVLLAAVAVPIAPAPARAVACPAAGGLPVPAAAVPAGGPIVFQGHGWGHGLGMSQYGAQGAARLGCTHDVILRTYYRGTTLKPRTLTAPVVLNLRSGTSRSTIATEASPVTWRTPAGVARTQPARTTWQVVRRAHGTSAGLAVLAADGAEALWVAGGARLEAEHSGAVVRVRSFVGTATAAAVDKRLRWDLARFAVTSSGTQVQEVVRTTAAGTAVQKYLWGLAEVPVSWPAEALRAQADAARTYLVKSWSAASGAFVIGVTTTAQVYSGATQEDTDAALGRHWRQAVDATKGELVVDSAGTAIWTMYCSSFGGHSESRAYVYGSQAGIGYLSAVDDSRWDRASDNPRRSWAKAFTVADLARRLGFTSVTAVRIGAPGSVARDGGLRVTGVRGGAVTTAAFTGGQLRYALGLLSPGVAVAWPPPPGTPAGTPAGTLQYLAGDWDGDGRTEVGTYKDAAVALRLHSGQVLRYRYGFTGATAVVGDWDGDGRDSIGVYHRAQWYLRDTLTPGPADRSFGYGLAGDLPAVGHWRGAGAGDGIAVLRSGVWSLRLGATPGPAQVVTRFGRAGDVPVVGDWNGDGWDDVGVHRGQTFVLARPRGGPATLAFGRATDVPVAGDWDGLGGDTPGVGRPAAWYVRNDLAGGIATQVIPFAG
jgi:hypothetical protein